MSKKRTAESSVLEKRKRGNVTYMVLLAKDDEPYEDPPELTEKQLAKLKPLKVSSLEYYDLRRARRRAAAKRKANAVAKRPRIKTKK